MFLLNEVIYITVPIIGEAHAAIPTYAHSKQVLDKGVASPLLKDFDDLLAQGRVHWLDKIGAE